MIFGSSVKDHEHIS